MNIGRDCTIITAKLMAAAKSWSTGSVSSSNMRFASSWNHAVSALRAAIGARQISGCAAAAAGRAVPSCSIDCLESTASNAGVPKRPNRNHDIPRTPNHPNEARASVDRKSTRLNSSHEWISYAVFCLKKKKKKNTQNHEQQQRKTTKDTRYKISRARM